MSQLIDMTGKRFGRLTVIQKTAPNKNARGAYWKCVCDCGNEKVVFGNDLRRGRFQSCGCLLEEKKKRSYKSTQCPYNDGCECLKKNCKRCGWNPEVAKARKEACERQFGG